MTTTFQVVDSNGRPDAAFTREMNLVLFSALFTGTDPRTAAEHTYARVYVDLLNLHGFQVRKAWQRVTTG